MTAGSAAPATWARGRVGNIVLWVLQALVAIAFLMAGAPKVLGSAEMVTVFDTIGAGQWLRVLIGVLEIAGAIALLLPWLAGLAGLAFIALMIGAVFTDIVILAHSPWFALFLLVLSAVIAWGRWPSTVRLFTTILRR